MPVELFTITCTTCKSRLKVREQAAIGQILACPKCGGMVMVKPPPSWSDVKGSQAEIQTASEVLTAGPAREKLLPSSAFDAVDDLLSDAPPRVGGSSTVNLTTPAAPKARRDSPVPAGKPRFQGGPPAPPPPPAAKTNSPVAGERPQHEVAGPAVRAKDSGQLAPAPPAEANAERQPSPSPPSSRLRFWLVAGGSAAVGIVLAFAAVTLALRIVRGMPPQIRRTTSSSSPDAAPATGPVVAPAQAAPPTANVAPALPPSQAEQAPANASPATSSIATNDVSPAPSPGKAATADPLGLVPQNAAKSELPQVSDSLAKLDRLIGTGVEETPPPAGTKPTAAAPKEVPEAAPSKPPAPRPPPREVDVAKRLADPLLGIESANTPLVDFLQTLSDLSTIPISLEPDALAIVNVSASSPVALKTGSITVGAAITEAIKPLKLESVVVEGQLVVRLAEPNPPTVIEVSARDLADGSEQQLGELAELLKSVIEPATWSGGADSGEITINAAKNALQIRHRRAVQAQVLLTCDKLRVARGKSPLLKLDPATFQLAGRYERAKPKLETQISLNYSQPTRLVTILERLQETANVSILVDWRDVAGGGWNPAAEATLVADKLPLAASLDLLVSPLDLTWRVVDGATLEIVSLGRLADRIETEVYRVEGPAAKDLTGESLLARLRDLLGEATFRDGGGNGELRFDVEGKCLIACLPQPKQRELAALLANWASEPAAK